MNRLNAETATDNGFTTIILAIDGSTTNNLGAGMVHALEFKLQDKMVSRKAVHKVIFTRNAKDYQLK